MRPGIRDLILLLRLGFAIGLVGSPGAGIATEHWQESAPGDLPAPPDAPTQGRQPVEVIPIDRLLKLPASYRVDDVRKGGATRVQWRARFDEAQTNLAEQEDHLAEVRAELSETAGNATKWQMAPPGVDLSNTENPVSFRLTQELRRSREAVTRAQKRLTELDIEANLASVPEDWRL